MSNRGDLLAFLAEDVSVCTDCRLHEQRTQTVFGRGDPTAQVVLVGEAPGEEEDLTGQPFVGKSGKLLDQMLAQVKFPPHYICNVVKCRPPNNRRPDADEIKACRPFFHGQLSALRPKVIVALGLTAASGLGIASKLPTTGGWRGSWLEGNPSYMVTFHPAYILRKPGALPAVVNDLRSVAERMR